MAPTDRSKHRDMRLKSKKHRKVHFKEKRHSNEKVRSSPRKFTPSPAKLPKPENYDSLILYYLTKLRKLFSTASSTGVAHHPSPGCREDSASKLRKEQQKCEIPVKKPFQPEHIQPERYTSSNPPKPRGEDEREFNYSLDRDLQDKVYNVVTAALEYGFANRVLEKKGDYFLLKSNRRNSKLANRQPTPGPRGLTPVSGHSSPRNVSRYCSKCSCNNCKSASSASNRSCCTRYPQNRPKTVDGPRDARYNAHSSTPRRSSDGLVMRANRSNCNCPRCQYSHRY